MKLFSKKLITGLKILSGVMAISAVMAIAGGENALAQNLPLTKTIPAYEDSSVVSSDGCWVYNPRYGSIDAYGQQALDTYSGPDASQLSTSCPKDVTIPSQIDGVNIIKIGNAAFYSTGATSIVVPSTIDEIRGGAFGGLHLGRFEFDDAISAYLLGNSGLGPVDILVYKGKEYKSTDPVDSRCFEDWSGRGAVSGLFGAKVSLTLL